MSDLPPRPSLGETANQIVGMVGEQNERLAENSVATAENTAAIADLTAATRHHRWWIRVIVVSFIFDVLVTLGLGFAYANSRRAAHDAAVASRINAQTLRTACLEGNATRAASVNLWEKTLAGRQVSSPEEQAKTDQFLAQVHEAYAQRDCG